MFLRLFRGRKWTDSAYAIYGALVDHARQAPFYTRLGVPDTVDGRFDMICLHAFLVIRRLQAEGGEAPALAQKLFDTMFKDMDRNLREMGVGDLSVGKHVKRMAKAYYGRAAAYEHGMTAGREVLEAALRRNLYRLAEPTDAQVAAMAAYTVAQDAALSTRPFAEVAAGRLGLTPPASDEPNEKAS
ncbi:ubiquinol-cytochrome C chaperone family protein [Novispirillum sp. DQ9]|uniref:ubiquinol-cytochrome C chaperone family protein n=1 Tax=Novispirillum sp. DQ9 TaxID=3398612 RepID=UPI003C7AB7A4